jgi:DNA-binding beta-propeller fold protein YncE
VTNGNTNDIAVVDLKRSGDPVVGLIPTGWYPNSVSFSADGKQVYAVNGKSPTGPNPGFCHPITPQQKMDCPGSNEYGLQLIKAGFQSFPTPTVSQLSQLTQQVSLNNHFNRKVSAADEKKMAELRGKIKHVIYIIKENRTYDEILGDLAVGNGDPQLVEFGRETTPNFHRIAGTFTDLDNFYCSSEVSMGGWAWSTGARAPDVVEKEVTVNYASRGLSYETEGMNRDVNLGYKTLAERQKANPLTPDDPDVLPGTANVAAPDGPEHEIDEGYLWDQALRAKLSVRNYGFFIDLTRYGMKTPHADLAIPETIDPAASHTVVAYATSAALRPYTDPYFRGFDNAFPDYYRFKEWEREFDTKYADGGLPQLSLVRLMHDHTGDFKTAILGVNTVELQEADNDYAVGLLVQKLAHSRYKDNTLVFVIEDDSQDGGDHVNSHRSTAYIVGPYVKQHAVVSTSYNTIDFIRTMEEVLGLKPLNLNDSTAVPMADAFDLSQKNWDFTATPSALLYNTQLPLPKAAAGLRIPKPVRSAAYWAKATKGMDFSVEDRIDFAQYNHILWHGMMGDKPYPEIPSGADLRANRAALLARYGVESVGQ